MKGYKCIKRSLRSKITIICMKMSACNDSCSESACPKGTKLAFSALLCKQKSPRFDRIMRKKVQINLYASKKSKI